MVVVQSAGLEATVSAGARSSLELKGCKVMCEGVEAFGVRVSRCHLASNYGV